MIQDLFYVESILPTFHPQQISPCSDHRVWYTASPLAIASMAPSSAPPRACQVLDRLMASSTDTYDIFLSFSGHTRYTFTDHLHDALVRRTGRRIFRDKEIDVGEELKPAIESAIVNSTASVVVLSKKYAESRWCLDELCLILEQRRTCNHIIVPVFYHVEPKDVRNQTGSFALEVRKRTKDDVMRWKAALTKVGNMCGMVLEEWSKTYEVAFITKVVDEVESQINAKEVSIPARFTGMKTRVEVFSSLLKKEQYNVVAICGMGGSGKTTLIEHVFKLNKQDFEGSSFIKMSRIKSNEDILELQKNLLKDVSDGNNISIYSEHEGIQKIERVLGEKKLLIVLDDVNDQHQLSTFLGTKAYPTQSKILITTRCLDIDAQLSWKCLVRQVELLNLQDSIEVLSWYAFKSIIPMDGFQNLTVQVARYCEGNPLALKVLGSSLAVSDQDQCKNKLIENFNGIINSLKSSNLHDIDSRIQVVLRRSFDSLSNSHKELFLDIACFFVGESKDLLTALWGGLKAESMIKTLVNRCLLELSPYNRRLIMHQLLRDMGKRIASEESENNPGQRGRIWNDDESYQVLEKGYGSDKIKGLSLDMLKVEQGMRPEKLALETNSIAKMINLKLLILKYVKFTKYTEKFPDLILLYWHGFPLKKIRSRFLVSTLVAIDVRYGHMETFEVPTDLESLKILNLEGCYKLVRINLLYRLPKLETLNLSNCTQLSHLNTSKGDLKRLANLFLTRCTKLWNASSSNDVRSKNDAQLILLSLPKSITFLELSSCDLMDTNDVHPDFSPRSLFNMYLLGNPFKHLPGKINLEMIRMLSLISCLQLTSIPPMPGTLVELYIDGCKSLRKVEFKSGRFTLEQFSYEGCPKLFEVEGLVKIVPIEKIDKANLVQHMQWIKECKDHKVDLVGDEITTGMDRKIKMLYEYGIMSTYLQGIKAELIPTYENTSSSGDLSFRVPKHKKEKKKKQRILGLHVKCLYKSATSMWLLLLISNRTKGLTWIYNPVVHCKPRSSKDAVWLSYWPIGNILDVGDDVHVEMIVKDGVIVSGCGASLEYGEAKNTENNELQGKEEIGGDLSAFELTKGAYYLCRRDLFGLETSSQLKKYFGDSTAYPESQVWRKTRKILKNGYILDYTTRILLKVTFPNRNQVEDIQKALDAVKGVEFCKVDIENGRLTVIGRADPDAVVKCAKIYGKNVDVLSVDRYLQPPAAS